MREILFRGKDIDTKEWLYGSLIYVEAGKLALAHIDWVKHEKPWDRGYRCCSEVFLNTVGQYTGLKDKNGVNIFEGDIVSSDIARPYLIVEFRNGCFMFNCNDGGEDYYDIMLPILQETQTVYQYGEVIGNIHDNPELIKK